MQVTSLVRLNNGFERSAHPNFGSRLSHPAHEQHSFDDFLDETPHVESFGSLTLAMEDFLALVELPTIPVIPNSRDRQQPIVDHAILPYGLPQRGDGSYLMKFDA